MSETKSETKSETNSETKRPFLPLWQRVQITAFFSYKEYVIASRTNRAVHQLFIEALDRGQISGTVFVRGQCTLEGAVDWVNEDETKTTIVLGRGEHWINEYLNICSAVTIVGDPRVVREKIVIMGGIRFNKRIGTCHLQHLTLRRANGTAVRGYSSFTMEDVLVDQCGGDGVLAYGIDARCTNVEVRQCGRSGVAAWHGACVTLVNTRVHDNCKRRRNFPYQDYELKASNGSRILLVYPLTRDNFSTCAEHVDNQIKTISEPVDVDVDVIRF
jgi:hypothetical protein